MSPIRRELLNGLLVLVLSTLLSAGIAAFQVKFNLQLWAFIVMGVAIAVTGYVMFEMALRYMASSEARETEWLKRIGTPARLDLDMIEGSVGIAGLRDAVKTMKPGSDLTLLIYVTSEGGRERALTEEARHELYGTIMAQLKRGTIREYKRIMCFDHDVLTNDPELKSGILRVGEGAGTITRQQGEHCRLMMETKECSLYVAPDVLKNIVWFYGTDKVSLTLDAADLNTGVRTFAGSMFFYDPPNGEIIEQFRQVERVTERRMVAVHKIVFPEDAVPRAELATR